tara:strand:- start:336 stop:842 length:507 start_codon:yes stop_codon:yes gene_type:complete
MAPKESDKSKTDSINILNLDNSQKSESKSISNIKQSFMNLNENKKINILLNFLVTFILIHEILICLFVGVGIKSILILALSIVFIPHIKIELDEELIAIFSGLFLGIRAVGLTLSGGWFSPFSTDLSDSLISNWLMFLSAPVLGVLLFFLLRYSIELFNHVSQNENKV